MKRLVLTAIFLSACSSNERTSAVAAADLFSPSLLAAAQPGQSFQPFDQMADATATLAIEFGSGPSAPPTYVRYGYTDIWNNARFQVFPSDGFVRDNRLGYVYSEVSESREVWAGMSGGEPVNGTIAYEPGPDKMHGVETSVKKLALAGALNGFKYVDFGYWKLSQSGRMDNGWSGSVAYYSPFAGGVGKIDPSSAASLVNGCEFSGKAIGGASVYYDGSSSARESIDLAGEVRLVFDGSGKYDLSIVFPGYYRLDYQNGSLVSFDDRAAPGNYRRGDGAIGGGSSGYGVYGAASAPEIAGVFEYSASGGGKTLSVLGAFGARR